MMIDHSKMDHPQNEHEKGYNDDGPFQNEIMKKMNMKDNK